MHKESKKDNRLRGVIKRLKTDKRFSLLVYGGAIVFALIVYFIGGRVAERKNTTVEAQPATQSAISQKDSLELRLVEVLSKIRGAGRVEVLITYETSNEVVTATLSQTDVNVSESDRNGSQSHSEQRKEVTEVATVSGQNGQEPIILYQKEPKVRGVIVVAEGASDPFVRLDLQRAVQAVTGASLNNIEVFEMTWSS